MNDKVRPIFLKNYFKTHLFLMPYELDREIQSEVFYLTKGSKTIRVCPSNKVDLAGLKSQSSGDTLTIWGKLFMYFTSIYTTTS